jgi:probable rRNA maturation factor
MQWAAPKPRGLNAPAIAAALRQYLRGLGYPHSGLVVFFGSDADLRALNARHRGKAKPTDVLSWSYVEGTRAKRPPLMGELALSLDRVRAQAKANGWPMQTEALRLLAHGCVHLAGYDHLTDAEDREMRLLEERLLARVGLRGLYPVASRVLRPKARARP